MRPRRLEDIRRPHLPARERPYEIVSRVKLRHIDYENFITDMLADRQFIEDKGEGCCSGAVMRCILVQEKGKKDGVLVVPEEGCYVMYAAYYVGESDG